MSERRFTFLSVEDTKSHKRGTQFTTYAQSEQIAHSKLKSRWPDTVFKLADVGEPDA